MQSEEQLTANQQNFIECLKSRKPTISTLESTIPSDTITHMMSIVVRTGCAMKYDPVEERIIKWHDETAQHRNCRVRMKWAV